MFFSGFAGEFGRQLGQARSEEADRAERSNQLEAGILQHLATSPDPEIASHGLTGLLDLADPTKANKRAGGLQGFLGKMATHPALPTIRQLISQGRQVEMPAHVPAMRMGEGAPSGLPGEVDVEGRPAATSAPPASAGAGSGAQAPAAAPPPVVAPGDVYTPPHTVTVPRHVFDTPAEQAGKTAEATRAGALQADIANWNEMTPAMRQAVFGHNLPITHTTDAQGNVHFFNAGMEIHVEPGAGQPKTPPRPTGPEAQAMERAREIMAANPSITADAALQQARTEHRTTVVTVAEDAHRVRLGQIQAMVPATLAAWQRVNGRVPMTRAQAAAEASRALSAARQTLGGGPDVTPEDITRFADGLMAATSGRRGPTVSPTRAALSQPLGTEPTPGAAPAATAPPQGGGSLTNTLQATAPGVAGAAVHPRAYSMQGKQTLQALATVEPLLTKLVAGIKAAGLENDNSVVGEQLNKLMYTWGIDPGDPETDRLFTTGISQAYGMRGLVGGRSNQILQKIYGQHLVTPGDSPKLLMAKAQDLLSVMPDIRKAVDDAEAAQVGARGKGKGAPPAPASAPATHPNSAIPDGTAFTAPDGKLYIKTGTNPDGTVKGRLATSAEATKAGGGR